MYTLTRTDDNTALVDLTASNGIEAPFDLMLEGEESIARWEGGTDEQKQATVQQLAATFSLLYMISGDPMLAVEAYNGALVEEYGSETRDGWLIVKPEFRF